MAVGDIWEYRHVHIGNGCGLSFRLNICNDAMETFHISILGGMDSGRGRLDP